MTAAVLGLAGVTSVIVVGRLRLAAEVEEETRLGALSIIYVASTGGSSSTPKQAELAFSSAVLDIPGAMQDCQGKWRMARTTEEGWDCWMCGMDGGLILLYGCIERPCRSAPHGTGCV